MMQQKLKLDNSGDLTIKSIAFVDFKKLDPSLEISERVEAENKRQKSKIEILSQQTDKTMVLKQKYDEILKF